MLITDQQEKHKIIAVPIITKALDVSADELLGLKLTKKRGSGLSLKLIRRMQKIEELSPSQQKFVFKAIDSLIKAAQK